MQSSQNTKAISNSGGAALLRLRPLIGLIARQVAEEDVQQKSSVFEINFAECAVSSVASQESLR
jgi:hypothetical protein